MVEQMQPEVASIPATNAADEQLGKVRLLTLSDLDGRTRAAQAARRLHDDLISDMGGEHHVSAGQMELAQRAAVMGALIEDIEARWLRGEKIPLHDYLAATNAQRRVLVTIGLERRARTVTQDPLAYAAAKAVMA